jgi:hypothetical protein
MNKMPSSAQSVCFSSGKLSTVRRFRVLGSGSEVQRVRAKRCQVSGVRNSGIEEFRDYRIEEREFDLCF